MSENGKVYIYREGYIFKHEDNNTNIDNYLVLFVFERAE
jgi:hypothetical protein